MKQFLLAAWMLLSIGALQSARAQVVINEIYGGGGNGGSTWKNDFIELYNNGSSPVDLTGWSVQYASAGGAAWSVTTLSGIIPPHGYYLVQEAAGGGGTTALPPPDATGTINMSATAGKVALCNNNTALSGAVVSGAQIMDKVGFGTGVSDAEGTAAPAPSATNSIQRTPEGTDNNTNSLDFTSITPPTPSNTTTGQGTTVVVAPGADGVEPSTPATFLVTLSSAAPAGGITIGYTLAGTATAGTDYTDPGAGSITIPAGSSSGTITLNINDDAAYEPAETIIITLNSATAPYTIATANATVNLQSDDINPVSLTTSIYNQDFNSLLVNSGTGSVYSLLGSGWAFSETGTAANSTYTAGTGSSNSGDTYSFGSSAADRAFGTVQSGSLVSTIGAQFINSTGTTITSLKISFTGEEWRFGATGRTDELDFQYSTDATSLSTGTWTNVTQLNFVTPNTIAAVGPIDGNGVGNNSALSYTITGLSIAPGAVFTIRWNDVNATGADDGLAIDDFSIEANPADLTPPQIATLNPSNGSTSAPSNLTATIVFDENVQKGTGNIVIKRKSDDAVVQTIDVTSGAVTVSGNTAYISFASLSANTQYYINIDGTAFSDLAANNFAGIGDNTSWAFTTSATLVSTYSFNTCTSGLSDGFTQFSVTGAITWACTSFGVDAAHSTTGSAPYGVQMNGYDNSIASNVQNEDWLISPSLNLTGTTYPLLSFWSRTAFNGQPLKLKVSTDYVSGDPSAATWTDLNGHFPDLASNVWTLSNNINLAAFKQSNVHIAFVYNSTNDDGARWTLDDISLDNSLTPPPPTLEASTTTLSFPYTASGNSTVKQFTILGNDLAGGGGINLVATGSFLLSKDNITFSSSINFTEVEANNVTKTVYVQFAPAQDDKNFTGTITVSTAGAPDQVVNLKATSIDAAKTLEVVNWNMEWFATPDPTLGPTNKTLQKQNAQTILQNIGADLYALVEVVDTASLGNIVRTMPGYDYIICNYGSHGNPNEVSPSPMGELQKEAFVYKTSVISNIDTTSLLSNGVNTAGDLSNPDYNYWSSGRYPFMMSADVTLDGVTKRVHFIAVHAKANTSPTATSYARRKSGADDLHTYLNTTFPNDNIVVLGDYNDDLDQTITADAGTTTTSWSAFTTDATSFYSPTLEALSLTGQASTVSYDQVIDHVELSNEMKAFYMPGSAAVLNDVTGLVTNYGNTTSDHYPVFTRYAFDAALLPVKLESFTAVREGNAVRTNWKSSEEINSSEYQVERSGDGHAFAQIGSVPAKGMASSYTLVDVSPLAGANYYRLKMVDKDGKFDYSKIVKVNFDVLSALKMSPNPASSYVNVTLGNAGAAGTLLFIDANGRVVHQEKIAQGTVNKRVNTGGWTNGLYTLKWVSGNGVTTQKLLIAR